MIGFKDQIEEQKQKIRESNYENFEYLEFRTEKLIGTLYIKEKMDYGFHIFFIHEPSNTNPLAGKTGTLSEMYYDLRNKVYWIKRNLKEVKFSVRNVDSIFPSNNSQRSKIFSLLSTEANKGLYDAAFRYLGAMGNEYMEMFGRFFYRLITEHSYYELLYKAGIPINKNIQILNRNGRTPMEILGINKTQWKIINKYKVHWVNYQNLDYEYRNNDKADIELINMLSYVKSLEDEFGIDKIHEFINCEFDYIYTNEEVIDLLLILQNDIEYLQKI